MDWNLDSLTPDQESAIRQHGYVAAFWRVLVQRLLETAPPTTESVADLPTPVAETTNTYIPLAHRK